MSILVRMWCSHCRLWTAIFTILLGQVYFTIFFYSSFLFKPKITGSNHFYYNLVGEARSNSKVRFFCWRRHIDKLVLGDYQKLSIQCRHIPDESIWKTWEDLWPIRKDGESKESVIVARISDYNIVKMDITYYTILRVICKFSNEKHQPSRLGL